ncbi:uncharacterized protein LOC135125088 [Zophobas morio]|uniref:uncharacterized protein LOC135125088 n=1 Tax=Zophobas morio TaxID=2755281 RepID=UPI003082B2F1
MYSSKLIKLTILLRSPQVYPKCQNVNHLRLLSAFNRKPVKPRTKQDEIFKNILKRPINISPKINFSLLKISLFDVRSAVAGFLLYKSVVSKINYEYFLDELQLSDSIFVRIVIIELCLWMFAAKANKEGHNGNALRESMLSLLSNHMNTKLKNAEKDNPELADLLSHASDFLQSSRTRFCEYDEALNGGDFTFATLLWKHFDHEDEVHSIYLHILLKMVKNIRRYIEDFDSPTVSLIFSPNMMISFLKWLCLFIFF